MTANGCREKSLSLPKRALLDLAAKELADDERHPFHQLSNLVSAVFHFEYHQRLEAIKEAYEPFDPDVAKERRLALSAEGVTEASAKVFDGLVQLMERANYRRLSAKEIEEAASQGASAWGVNMAVDLSVFSRLEIFACGEGVATHYHRRWRRRWRLEEVLVPTYRRLVIIFQRRQHDRHDPCGEPQLIYAKLFKDIPKIDLEMLVPGTRVLMPGMQRLKLGGSIMSSIGLVVWKIAGEAERLVVAAIQRNPFAFWGPISLMFGYGWKQYSGFQSTKQSYSLMLTQRLYYHNLDNNSGVFTRLLDVAEEQECAEAILAYFFLWRHAENDGLTEAEVDAGVEKFLREQAKLAIDFEIHDALAKLVRLGLVSRSGERYSAISIAAALEQLDRTWDNYFTQANHGG